MSGYVLGEPLFGTVHRGYHRRSHPSRSLLVTFAERSELEALAPRFQLPVPGIAPMVHLGRLTGGRAGVIEEEPSGRPLSAVALPLRPDTVAVVVRQIAAVLAGVHRIGAALGGLQPELIYARPAASGPVLTGVAPRAGMLLRRALPFAHSYLAPGETWEPATDVFSLCALASHWLSGHHPFRGVESSTQVIAIARGDRRPWRGPPGWSELITRGLGDPCERPSLAELVDAFDALGAVAA